MYYDYVIILYMFIFLYILDVYRLLSCFVYCLLVFETDSSLSVSVGL